MPGWWHGHLGSNLTFAGVIRGPVIKLNLNNSYVPNLEWSAHVTAVTRHWSSRQTETPVLRVLCERAQHDIFIHAINSSHALIVRAETGRFTCSRHHFSHAEFPLSCHFDVKISGIFPLNNRATAINITPNYVMSKEACWWVKIYFYQTHKRYEGKHFNPFSNLIVNIRRATLLYFLMMQFV